MSAIYKNLLPSSVYFHDRNVRKLFDDSCQKVSLPDLYTESRARCLQLLPSSASTAMIHNSDINIDSFLGPILLGLFFAAMCVLWIFVHSILLRIFLIVYTEWYAFNAIYSSRNSKRKVEQWELWYVLVEFWEIHDLDLLSRYWYYGKRMEAWDTTYMLILRSGYSAPFIHLVLCSHRISKWSSLQCTNILNPLNDIRYLVINYENLGLLKEPMILW